MDTANRTADAEARAGKGEAMDDIVTTGTQAALVVETASGRVRGASIEGVAAFKCIPYGAPSSGANRFMPPRKPTPWAGVRDALDYTGHAPQQGLRPATRVELADFSGPPDTSPETEDCLTLNVWSANPKHGAKRPVMVWFHGGAFAYGTANVARLQGTRLATRGDVVVVTVNQRLNIFGFLDLSEIGGTDYAASGNAGTLDMIAALEWVRDNIDRFGGDPGNVTIFGESGGGGKVCTLLTMPSARGLFHRAIVQSGAAIRLRERDRAAKLSEAVLKALGLSRTDLDKLQSLPMAQLLAAVDPAQKAIGPAPMPLFDRYPFGPVVDGTIVPSHPFDPAAPAVSADIPLLIGDMKDEMASFLARDDKVWHRTLTEQEMRDRVAAVAGRHADHVDRDLSSPVSWREPGRAADRHADQLKFPHSLVDRGREKGGAGRRAGLHVLVPVGDAGPRRSDESTARTRCAFYVRYHRSDQRDRSQRGGTQVGRDDVWHLGRVRPHRQARESRDPAMACV